MLKHNMLCDMLPPSSAFYIYLDGKVFFYNFVLCVYSK
jgi:hypothetical protein